MSLVEECPQFNALPASGLPWSPSPNDGSPPIVVPLLPHHRIHLAASGLSDETLAAAGVSSETNLVQAQQLLNNPRFNRRQLPAIVFPYSSPNYCRLRPDTPRERDGKPVKYEAPVGQPNQIYIPPLIASSVISADVPLLITEGEKKTLAACQAGFCCIGLSGAFAWCLKGQEDLLPGLKAIPLAGRIVYIIYDSDAATNNHVRDAESRLARALSNHGAIVRVVRLPPGPPGSDGKPSKVGLDDFLVAAGMQGPQQLQQLLDAAGDPEPVDPGTSCSPSGKVDPAQLAKEFLTPLQHEEQNHLRCWNDVMYRWNGSKYLEIPPCDLRANLISKLGQKYSHITRQVLANLTDHVKSQTNLPASVILPAFVGDVPLAAADWRPGDVMAMSNGLVNLRKLAERDPHPFLSPSPAFFTFTATDFPFPASPVQCAVWDQFLEQLFGRDLQAVQLLQEWMGYCLTADTSLQKILLLIGPKRSGKGTIARVLTSLIGAANVVAPSLTSLGNNFGLWSWMDKLLAIFADARLTGRSDQAMIIERLLSISGEDMQTIDRKNLPPITLKLPARIMLITNELPLFMDVSGALAGRMLILQLRNSFYEHEDPQLTTRLLAELPAILLWAVEGRARLRARGQFFEPISSAQVHRNLHELTSPIAAFVEEGCVIGPGQRVAVRDLYHAWMQWCAAAGREAGTQARFGRDLHTCLPSIERERITTFGQRSWIYAGVGLRQGG